MVSRETASPDVSRDDVEGNISTRGKTKLTSFPMDHTLRTFALIVSAHPYCARYVLKLVVIKDYESAFDAV